VSRPGHRVVLVSGAPGSGKTSLAAPLAAELGFALLGKDRIKETLHDALGAPEPDLAGRVRTCWREPLDVMVTRFR
jgi:predicted kinase